MVLGSYRQDSLHFTVRIQEALEVCDICFIAVGTPMGEDGSRTRSFCYVDDLVDGMCRMMDSREGFTGPVNLGNSGEFTMLELAEKVIDLTGSASRITYGPLPLDDPMQRKPVIDLAENFRMNYVKTGIFDVRYSDILGLAFDVRSASGYNDFYVISKEKVEEQIMNAEDFLQEVKKYLAGKSV